MVSPLLFLLVYCWVFTFLLTSADDDAPACVPFPDVEDGCMPYSKAVDEATLWLRARLPTWDSLQAQTLFGRTLYDVDGLDTGIVTVGVNASMDAKVKYPWAHDIPISLYYEYNTAFCVVNEARNNWRPFLTSYTEPLVRGLLEDAQAGIKVTITEVVDTVNKGLWAAMGKNEKSPIYFKAGQTPLIFDPFSTYAFGYASCTGISILFVDALRTVGVASRLAGTPDWHSDPEQGNHNWVEVFDGETWGIIEGLPAAQGESLEDPCSVWFCNEAHFTNGTTHIYASRFDKFDADTYYHAAWDIKNTEIPGEDRTWWYTKTCTQCSRRSPDVTKKQDNGVHTRTKTHAGKSVGSIA